MKSKAKAHKVVGKTNNYIHVSSDSKNIKVCTHYDELEDHHSPGFEECING